MEHWLGPNAPPPTCQIRLTSPPETGPSRSAITPSARHNLVRTACSGGTTSGCTAWTPRSLDPRRTPAPGEGDPELAGTGVPGRRGPRRRGHPSPARRCHRRRPAPEPCPLGHRCLSWVSTPGERVAQNVGGHRTVASVGHALPRAVWPTIAQEIRVLADSSPAARAWANEVNGPRPALGRTGLGPCIQGQSGVTAASRARTVFTTYSMTNVVTAAAMA